MKNLFLTSLILFSSLVLKAQILSIGEVRSLMKKDAEEINDYLITRDWSLVNSSTEDSTARVTYGFEFNNKTKEASIFLNIYFLKGLDNNIKMTFFGNNIYKNYINDLKNIGAKKESSKVSEDGVTTLFKTKNELFFVDTRNGRFIITIYTNRNIANKYPDVN